MRKWSIQDPAEVPKLLNVDNETVHNTLADTFPSEYIPKMVNKDGIALCAPLHSEYAMIKYARAGQAIPHERVFKIDPNNVQVMWRPARKGNGYQYRCTLALDNVVEVRCGQQTRNFNQFPYLEVERQSFSLMFEREQGEWSQLSSLDLICDSMSVFQDWKTGLKELIYAQDGGFPFCKLNEIADPVTIYLKRHWATMEHKDRITFDQALSFVHKFSPDVNKRETRNFMKSINKIQRGFMKENENLSWDSFLVLFHSLNNQPKVHDIFKKYAQTFPDLGMAPQELLDFMKTEQKETSLTIQSCINLIEHHDEEHLMYKRMCAKEDPSAYQISRRLLSYQGFLSFLRSKDNAAFDFSHEMLHQDLDQPLSHYFINSSHNTYLTGHQLKGLSSCEAYVRALQLNCRCLELDCWDGAEEPVITHGMTLTSKIRFRDVLEVIKEYAFETNPFPVILSLENHCSSEQQFMMANMFVNIFGDLLATEDLSENNVLPSPNQLQKKIILKGRPKAKKKSKGRFGSVKHHPSPYPGMPPRSFSQSSIRTESGKVSLSPRTSSATTTTTGADDTTSQAGELTDDLVQIPLDQSMGRLIVYCRAVPFKRGDLSESCCEMHSFNEGLATELIDRMPADILYLSKKKMLRTYPKGSRVDSSNYNPMQMWKAGIHMASINFQKPDAAMHINAGFFRTNGNCGYVLKPECMRKAATVYHPAITESPGGKETLLVEMEILSAQVLHTDLTGYQPVSVEVEVVGIDEDCATFATEVTTNCFNPEFQKGTITFKVVLDELCLVYFKILSCGRAARLLLQTVIPITSLKQGLRYIPMKTLTGAKACESGLYVMIKISPFKFAERNVSQSS